MAAKRRAAAAAAADLMFCCCDHLALHTTAPIQPCSSSAAACSASASAKQEAGSRCPRIGSLAARSHEPTADARMTANASVQPEVPHGCSTRSKRLLKPPLSYIEPFLTALQEGTW